MLKELSEDLSSIKKTQSEMSFLDKKKITKGVHHHPTIINEMLKGLNYEKEDQNYEQ